jgi:glutamate dehydrogenase/leucine dehydrogenase
MMATHALVHGINGHTNATATDVGTFTPDMDVMVRALLPYMDPVEAYAAVSGASKQYKGVPDFQMRVTGEGASAVLEEYLAARMLHGDPTDEIGRKLHTKTPLDILQQALGKAGAPFALKLPQGTQLRAAVEYAGGLEGLDGPLDPSSVVDRAKENGLILGSARRGERWFAAKVTELWRLTGDILVPAYDKDQVGTEDIRSAQAAVGVEIANGGFTQGARQAARQLHFDIIDGRMTNMGGTLGSSKRARMLLYREYADRAAMEDSWRDDMHRIAKNTFAEMYAKREEWGRYVSPEEIILANIARRSQLRRAAVPRRFF